MKRAIMTLSGPLKLLISKRKKVTTLHAYANGLESDRVNTTAEAHL
jgi:hypothetical protein